ncbi:hypothetical protein [Mycolicibacterium goodii]|uniref:hypothetical protein n=1 Tax=Mycolicibacterium goodii TaxID=134601 RepID=UPI00067373EE
MLGLVRTLPIPVPWSADAFVRGIADMRGRPITLIATEPEFLSGSLCSPWLAREDDDVIVYERGATDFRIHQVICHQIGHMILGHHRGEGGPVRDPLTEPASHPALPDHAAESASTAESGTGYGDEQEYEADLFALLLMNGADWQQHSIRRRSANRSTAARSQQRARSCGPPPTAYSDLTLVRGYARNVEIACDFLHDEPFSPQARANLLRLILHDSRSADAANKRLRDGFARGQ